MCSPYSGLDASFLYVKDMTEKDALMSMVSSDDNLPRLNIWTLQEPEKADLLKVVIRPEQVEQTVAMIVLDFD